MTTTAPAEPAPPPPPPASAEDQRLGRAPDDLAPPSHRRRRVVLAVVAAVVVVAAVAVGVAEVRSGTSSSTAAPPPAPSTATIARHDIGTDQTFDGTIAPTTAQPLVAHTSGILTMLPTEGSPRVQGDQLFAVAGSPTYLLYGKVPAWRELSPATPAGDDVAQLQQAMIDLGYDPDHTITVDGTFGASTAAAVERWQTATGQPATGLVPLGTVAFQPGPITIGSHQVEIGGAVAAGSAVADTATTGFVATFALPNDVHTVLQVGQAVDVTLPDYTTTKGTITAIGTVTDASTGVVSLTGTVSVPDPGRDHGIVDQAPIKVKASQVIARNVLVVPAAALVSHVDGRYEVTVVGADGSTRPVAVEVGVSANGSVEVRGAGIAEGTKVVVPTR